MKLDSRWKLFELFCQHEYILNSIYANKKDKEASEAKVLSAIKKILKKSIKAKDIPKIQEEIDKHFYKDKIKHSWGRVPLLGPIGSAYIRSSKGALLDLEDIEEVHVTPTNFSGSIKSKSCGWISWLLVKGDKSIFNSKHLTSEYQYLISMNHFKQDTADKEIAEKFVKYKNSKEGRTFKRFFVSSRFWFHDDLEKLWKSLPYKYL